MQTGFRQDVGNAINCVTTQNDWNSDRRINQSDRFRNCHNFEQCDHANGHVAARREKCLHSAKRFTWEFIKTSILESMRSSSRTAEIALVVPPRLIHARTATVQCIAITAPRAFRREWRIVFSSRLVSNGDSAERRHRIQPSHKAKRMESRSSLVP